MLFTLFEEKMSRLVFVALTVVIVWLAEAKATSNGSRDDLDWTSGMGNAHNTRRLIPSTPTGFNGSTWTLTFNASSQDTTVFGAAAGANGDLYLFITDSRYSSGMVGLKPLDERNQTILRFS